MPNGRLARQCQKNKLGQATRHHKKLSSLTNNTKLRHKTTTQPIYQQHQPMPLPSHSTQRQGTRQQVETTKPPTANSERKRREARNDFFDQNQRHLTEFASYQNKSNTTFFPCYFFFLVYLSYIMKVFFFQAEDIIHLLIFSDLFEQTIKT